MNRTVSPSRMFLGLAVNEVTVGRTGGTTPESSQPGETTPSRIELRASQEIGFCINIRGFPQERNPGP
jgi:hypothetical protein